MPPQAHQCHDNFDALHANTVAIRSGTALTVSAWPSSTPAQSKPTTAARLAITSMDLMGFVMPSPTLGPDVTQPANWRSANTPLRLRRSPTAQGGQALRVRNWQPSSGHSLLMGVLNGLAVDPIQRWHRDGRLQLTKFRRARSRPGTGGMNDTSISSWPTIHLSR